MPPFANIDELEEPASQRSTLERPVIIALMATMQHHDDVLLITSGRTLL